ncbi:MAG TPA: hypothetical protein VGF14_00995 [Alphaproteobacteria bacterium]
MAAIMPLYGLQTRGRGGNVGIMKMDFLIKFLNSLAKKPAGEDKAPVVERQKDEIAAQKAKSAKEEKIIFLILAAVVTLGYLGYAAIPEKVDGESVIPLAQLTGNIKTQPRNETPEQQFRRENKNVPLSDGSTIPAEIVKSRTRQFRQVPFGDKELEYELRLPISWGQSKFARYGAPGAEKYDVLTNIDRYFGPSIEDERPFFWVEVEKLDRLSMSAYYMDMYFIKRGITPESVKIMDSDRAEALYVDVRNYSTFALRSQFIIHGDRVIVITFGVPLTDYKSYKDIMGLALNSFKLLNPINRTPEPFETYKLLNILSFNYLPRWLPRNENRTSSLNPSVEFILPTELNLAPSQLMKGQQIEGLILVHAWRNRPGFNRQTIEQTIIQRLAMGGLKMKDVLQPEKNLSDKKDTTTITQAIYIGLVDQSPPTTEEFGIVQNDSAFPRQEVWVTVLDNGDYTAAVTLVTWPQTKNYQQWAANVVAYKTILKSLKLRKLVF